MWRSAWICQRPVEMEFGEFGMVSMKKIVAALVIGAGVLMAPAAVDAKVTPHTTSKHVTKHAAPKRHRHHSIAKKPTTHHVASTKKKSNVHVASKKTAAPKVALHKSTL